MADIGPALGIPSFRGGEGERTVVLLHGFPQTWWKWHRVIPPLVEAGFRVVAPDYRGAGHSWRPHGGYHKRTMAAAQAPPDRRPHRAGRSRYRADGGLCLCPAASGRGLPPGGDGCADRGNRRVRSPAHRSESLAFRVPYRARSAGDARRRARATISAGLL